MKRILVGFIILAFFATAFSTYKAYAEQKRLAVKAEKAVILFMEGTVKVKAKDTDNWVDAAKEMTLSAGDSLKTAADSWAEVGFGKDFKNVVRIKEKTLVEFIALAPVKVGLLKGEVRSLVERLARDSTFEIKTPTAVCGARGTGWDTNTDGRKVVVDAYEDEVYFYPLTEDEGAVVDPVIKAGKRGILEDPTRPITIKDLPLDRMKDWSRWKEDFKQRSASEKGGIKDKADKMENNQKTIEGLMKGKESMMERMDQQKMDRRLEEKEPSSYESHRDERTG